MATTQAELDALISARNRGVLSVGHGDKRVQYRSLDEMDRLIARMRRELSGTHPKTFGLATTKRGI
jgi:hypothetical protein